MINKQKKLEFWRKISLNVYIVPLNYQFNTKNHRKIFFFDRGITFVTVHVLFLTVHSEIFMAILH